MLPSCAKARQARNDWQGNELASWAGWLSKSSVGPISGLCLLVGLPLIVVACLMLSPDWPDTLPSDDEAGVELYTWHTLEGLQLEVPYRHEGVRRLGPMYFYVLAPLYWLTGCKYVGLCLTAILINLSAIAAVLLLTHRCAGRAALIWSALLLTLYIRFMGVTWLVGVWSPWVVLMPFVAASVLFAAIATGRLGYLPAALFVSSFIAQTQLGYVPALAILAALSLLLATVPKLRKRSGLPGATSGNMPRILLGCLIVLALAWALPLIKQMIGGPGNVLETLCYFADQGVCHTWRETVSVVMVTLAAFPSSCMGFDLKRVLAAFETSRPLGEEASLCGILAGAQVLLVPVSYWLARRRGRDFEAVLCLFSAALLGACTFSVRRIVGPIALHYVFWMTSLSLFSLFVVGGALFAWLVELRWIALSQVGPRVVGLAALAAIVVGCALNVSSALEEIPQIQSTPVSDCVGAKDVKFLVAQSRKLLEKRQFHSCLVRIVGLDRCGAPSGLLLGLTKAGFLPVVDREYERFFSSRHAMPEHVDGMFLVCDLTSGQRLGKRSEQELVAETSEVVLLWSRLDRNAEGRYSFDELEAFARRYDGFWETECLDNDSWRWSKGTESALVVGLEKGRPYRLTLTVAPLVLRDRTQGMTVLLNGRALRELVLAAWPSWQEFEVILPAAHVEETNEIVFRYRYAELPSRLQVNADTRRLAVRFKSIRFQPIKTGTGLPVDRHPPI